MHLAAVDPAQHLASEACQWAPSDQQHACELRCSIEKKSRLHYHLAALPLASILLSVQQMGLPELHMAFCSSGLHMTHALLSKVGEIGARAIQ